MPAEKAQNKPAQGAQRARQGENPYLNAKSLDELRRMEAQLYEDTWEDGKIRPHMEEHYNHQMELFLEAFAALFPEEYNLHRTIGKP